MKKKHTITLQKVFHRPVLGTINWSDIEALLVEVGARVEEREGSRVAIILDDIAYLYHRPHPRKEADKAAVSKIRKLLIQHNIKP